MPFRSYFPQSAAYDIQKSRCIYYYISKFGNIPFRIVQYSVLVFQPERKKGLQKVRLSLKRLRNEKTFSVLSDPGQTEYEMPLAAPGQRQKKDIKVGLF